MDTTQMSWEKFLNPAVLRSNLVNISLFIASYELFTDRIIEKPIELFSSGFNSNGPILDQETYKKEVLSLAPKNKLVASMLWFKTQDAISECDLNTFYSVRVHRNELAHETIQFLSDAGKSFDVTKFHELLDLLTKIEKWWFVNFEAAIDPDMLPDGADANDVIPGPVWAIQLMFDIALGNEPSEGHYYNMLKSLKT